MDEHSALRDYRFTGFFWREVLYAIFLHVVFPMASMSFSLQRQPSFSATYSAADGGVAQNILCSPPSGYAMQTQKGATGPAGGSPFFVKEEKQYSHASSADPNGPRVTSTKAREERLIISFTCMPVPAVALGCDAMLSAGTSGFPRRSMAPTKLNAIAQRKNIWFCIGLR